MRTADGMGRGRVLAAAGAAALLAGIWMWQPSSRAATGTYDVAISAGDTLRLEQAGAGAVHQVASSPNRTLACVSVMRLGFFDAGLKCVALSAGMSARTLAAERRGAY